MAAYRRGGWDGIGYVPTAGEGITGIDLDHCREGKIIKSWARRIATEIDSYTEISPSGTGLRIIALGQRPDTTRSKRGNIEIYDGVTKEGKSGGRYLTFTGHRLKRFSGQIQARQEQLAAVYYREVNPPKDSAPNTKEASTNGKPAELDDIELIRRATRAKNGAKFRALWKGDTSGYRSASEADLALCSLLAFWVGPDFARIERLFRRSGLFRDKWQRADYCQRTIQAAVAGRSAFYRANRRRHNGCTLRKVFAMRVRIRV
jgi:primase-polymerase (primpol)-like protein